MAELTEEITPTLCKHLRKVDNEIDEYVGLITPRDTVRWECLRCSLEHLKSSSYLSDYIVRTPNVENLSHASKLKVRVAIEAALAALKPLSKEQKVTHANA